MILFRLILAAAMLSILPLGAEAADVSLAWDSNSEEDLAGYHVGYGLAPGNYSAMVDVGNTTAYKVFNLEPNRTYYFVVRAYNFQGSVSPFSAEVSTTTASPQLAMTSVSMNQSSPKPVGTAVTFSANVSGGVAPYQYTWFVSNGLTSTLVRDWATTATYTWQPTAAGTYQITVWVRSAGDAASATSSMTVPFTIEESTSAPSTTTPPPSSPTTPPPSSTTPPPPSSTTPPPSTTTPPPSTPSQPVTVTPITASLSSPQPVGTSIRFTANGAGGVSPLEYRWLLSMGQGWHVQQNWGTSNSLVWTPTMAGQLWVWVQVRSAVNSTDTPDAQQASLMTILP